jgi:HPt (histidine-containing phosphotransfer) domain-containing protein
MDADVFAERLTKVRDRFTSTLESKLEETDSALAGLSGDGATVVEAVGETYRRLHGIAGTGPTLGFPVTGQAAREAETVLIVAKRDRRGLTTDEVASLKNALHALRQAATGELQANSNPSV